MVVSASVVVGSTATRLVGGGSIAAGAQRVLIKNTHATDKLIIGGPGVAANNGYGIDAGQSLDVGDLEPNDAIWAIRGGSNDITAQILAK
jgi:hypothetical protein